ncbi:hypothetical protein [Frigoribacterium sp. VKM Ac-2530]|uniref:hypothetical protein n=1 Tax=Frigoribacterium sp. VKM Ac-2530 TaxID=2783822 RepID=UPI00188D552D|nr:hypothetical protein [Frigoribacterium sp. VKM Ac-2530]MBF4578614.1 hypothetical protein [Frigoribacterium sp. VKM Ac-2530]
MHVLSPDEALVMLLADDADDQAGTPLDEDREIVVLLSDQDLLTVELSMRDVVASMDRREFTDHMPLGVDELLRWADDLRLLRRSIFGERELTPLTLSAVRARRIDWPAWSEDGDGPGAPREHEAWFRVSGDDLAIVSSAVRHATDRDPAVMEPVDARHMTDDTVGRALDASLHSIARDLYKRA